MAADAPPRASLVYTWEPSDAAIAHRYGLRPDQILRFDTNTSPVAPEQLIAATLAAPLEMRLNEYPDSSYEELTEAIAAYNEVPADRIVVGAGADEILDLVAKAFLPSGGTAIVPTPTYGMYGVLTGQRAATVLAVPRLGWDQAFALDLERIVPALSRVQLVWLCTPNNPTGTFDAEDVIRAVLDAAGALPDPPIVAVDEAYFEFVGRTLATAIEAYQHLVVVRTVSKAFALAGVRVGYSIAARPTIERLERVRPPGSISTTSAALATAALRSPEVARANVATLIAERQWLAARLGEAGHPVQPSVTNFLLVRIGDAAAAAKTTERLQHSGIVPRTFDADHPLAGHLRLTVRTRAQNERLLEALG
jgi:histidinol-phosphate aminotransferase